MACVNRVSFTSVDLPEPDTPVTQVNRPKGNSAFTFLRSLFSRNPFTAFASGVFTSFTHSQAMPTMLSVP